MENNEITDKPTEGIESGNKPTEGTYDNMTPSGERKPKVEFIFNESVEVSFNEDFEKPVEFPSQDRVSVYYLFHCTQNSEEKVFLTSAWSLLQGLKNIEPLAGKTILITKDMKDGKQHYSVEEVEGKNEDDVEVVKVGEEPEPTETPEVPEDK